MSGDYHATPKSEAGADTVDARFMKPMQLRAQASAAVASAAAAGATAAAS
jgi:hypothetical protein